MGEVAEEILVSLQEGQEAPEGIFLREIHQKDTGDRRHPYSSMEECITVINNFARRIQVCLQQNGGHLEHIL